MHAVTLDRGDLYSSFNCINWKLQSLLLSIYYRVMVGNSVQKYIKSADNSCRLSHPPSAHLLKSLHSSPRTSCTWQRLDDDHSLIYGTHNRIQVWSTFLFSCERCDQSSVESFIDDIPHYQVLDKARDTYFIGGRKLNIPFLKNFQKPSNNPS